MSQPTQFQSAREWYEDGGPLAGHPHVIRSFVPEADRVIAAGPVHVINVSPPAGAVVEQPVPEYSLNLLLRTPPLLRVGFNRPPRWLAVSPGSMIFAPPDVCCEFIADAGPHVLAVSIPKSRAREFAEETGARIDLREEAAFRQPRLMQQLVRLWHELAEEAPASQLFADEVMRTVLEALAKRTGAPARLSARVVRERLPNGTVRRLRDYIEHSLATDLDVKVMADVANLSPAHFARAFAATLGMTPFRYVMTRRLAKARELLEHTRRSTVDIASGVGFKTTSHFTSRFRREFGVTPGMLRPDARRSLVLHVEDL
jgi:AraC family transcriptional regulator